MSEVEEEWEKRSTWKSHQPSGTADTPPPRRARATRNCVDEERRYWLPTAYADAWTWKRARPCMAMPILMPMHTHTHTHRPTRSLTLTLTPTQMCTLRGDDLIAMPRKVRVADVGAKPVLVLAGKGPAR